MRANLRRAAYPQSNLLPCPPGSSLAGAGGDADALCVLALTGDPERASAFDTLIVGAGPSGLTAAAHLVDAGQRPLVIERSDQVGGLIRSLKRGPFVVDLGRKELYARIPEIDRLWNSVLGAEYRPYPHRVGSLFNGRILELSGRYRGPLRGMPPDLLLTGGVDLLRGWVDGAIRKPDSYERFWHQRVGRSFSRALAQGYWEKFRGQSWRSLPVPEVLASGEQATSHGFAAVMQSFKLAARGGVSRQGGWRHPARGTGQLTDLLATRIRRGGGEIRLNAELVALEQRTDGPMLATIRRGGETFACLAKTVISSLAPETLGALLQLGGPVPRTAGTRTVMLVYLFQQTPPRFPHAWLEVNDPAMRAGRITSYSAFGGDMAPPGTSALCVEYFLDGDDARLPAFDDQEWIRQATTECHRSHLIDPDHVVDAMVVRLDRCNAAASWREEQDRGRAALYDRLRAYPGLFHVHRPGADWASFAGLCAADAVLTKDRREFDRRADPTRSYASSNAEMSQMRASA